MSQRNLSILWDYFIKTEKDDKNATCKNCGHTISYKTTTENLEEHLKVCNKSAFKGVTHEQDVARLRSDNFKRRANYNLIWKFFERYNIYERLAKCNYCKKVISYNSTTGNLGAHLKRHSEAYSEYLRRSNCKKSRESSNSENDEHSEDGFPYSVLVTSQNDDSNSLKTSEVVCRQFHFQDSVAHCIVCEKTLKITVEDMKTHLKEDHPLILQNIIQNKDTIDSTDVESHSTKDIYTDAVYEDIDTYTDSKITSEDNKNNIKIDTDQEISTFLEYIRVLMKRVSRKELPTLHVDIINTIISRTD